MPTKPDLEVWDSCCLTGILNNEKDKVPALLSRTRSFEQGEAILGIPIVVIGEVVALSDGTPAKDKVERFLQNPYVETLESTREVGILCGELQYRFDSRRLPELKAEAIKAGVPNNQVIRLRHADSEVLATALHYKAKKLTTYDPFLIFIGAKYITGETGLVIGPPDTEFLPFPDTEPIHT
jgi:hypothetical protein